MADAFPIGNVLGGVIASGHPWFHTALGRSGPSKPSPANFPAPFQIPDKWDYGHHNYLEVDSEHPSITVPRDVPPQGADRPGYPKPSASYMSFTAGLFFGPTPRRSRPPTIRRIRRWQGHRLRLVSSLSLMVMMDGNGFKGAAMRTDSDILNLLKSAPLRSAAMTIALLKRAPRSFAPLRCASLRFAPLRCQTTPSASPIGTKCSQHSTLAVSSTDAFC